MRGQKRRATNLEHPSNDRSFVGYSIGIFLFALLVRGVHVWQFSQTPFFPLKIIDAESYDAWARRIAGGDWLGGEVFYQAPLYPYFLGVVYAVLGDDPLTVRIYQALLGAVSCVLIAHATRRLFSAATGIAAGLILALYAPAIFLDSLIQKSVLDLFSLSLALWLLSGLMTKTQTARTACFCVGAALGCLVLTRENALVLVLVVLFWLAVQQRGTPRRCLVLGALYLAGLAVVLLPVATRNRIVGGEFHLTTSQLGPNLYIGNNECADGVYHPLRAGRADPKYERTDATQLAEQATGRKLSPAEVSSYWTGRVLDYIRSRPGDWLRLMWRKWVLVWNATETNDGEDQYTYADFSLPLRVTGFFGHLGVLAPLAVLGIGLTWSERHRLWLLYLMLLAYAASVAAFYVFGRYRYPIVPLLVPFAAAGLTHLGACLRQGRRAVLVGGLAVAVVAAVFCNWPMTQRLPMRAYTYANAGAALARQGKPAEAIDFYHQALRIMPDNIAAHFNLGNALRAQGKLEKAIEQYRATIHVKANHRGAHGNLANLLSAMAERRGDRVLLEEAIRHYEIALQIDSGFASAHFNLGMALVSAGRTEQALPRLEKAVALDPAAPAFSNALAWHLATHVEKRLRDPIRAVELAERACRQTDNQDPALLDTLAAACAAAGKFDRAVAIARKALELAGKKGEKSMVREIRERLMLYERDEPYVEKMGSAPSLPG